MSHPLSVTFLNRLEMNGVMMRQKAKEKSSNYLPSSLLVRSGKCL
jgi:hypothetical protein